ncbi:MAG: sigma-54-dependent transcriptional regulator [Phycisphaerae bacterium]
MRIASHGILLIDPQGQAAPMILEQLAARAIHGQLAGSLKQALDALRNGNWAAAIVHTDSGDSIEASLDQIARISPELPVAVVTDQATLDQAVAAMRAGAFDLLAAPLSPETISALLDRLAPYGLGSAAEGSIIGTSQALSDCLQLARRIGPTSLPVLVGGPSGTGKELISQYIHRHSRRANGPFIRVNCAALNESLLESELFGHEKGAFTGAVGRRKGRFERADGGTLLLDEISETTGRLQAELLRVLESQDIERVGGSETIRVNVRVIATTNRNLAEQVEKGDFRRDLYYRISGLRLDVPALAQRREDIPALVAHFIARYAGQTGRRINQVDRELLETLYAADWPGNVRQLRNTVRALLALGSSDVLSLDDAPHLRQELAQPVSLKPSRSNSLKLQELERRAIFEALRRTEDHQAKAARLLGITDRTLRSKLRRYRDEGQDPNTQEIQPCRELQI